MLKQQNDNPLVRFDKATDTNFNDSELYPKEGALTLSQFKESKKLKISKVNILKLF
jgi:hypothetical protein